MKETLFPIRNTNKKAVSIKSDPFLGGPLACASLCASAGSYFSEWIKEFCVFFLFFLDNASDVSEYVYSGQNPIF